MTADEHATLNALSDDTPVLTEEEVGSLADNYGRPKPRYIGVHESVCDKVVEGETLFQEIASSIPITYYATICDPGYKRALYKVQDDGTLLLITRGDDD